jgi:DNA polymerase-3 subunit alpha
MDASQCSRSTIESLIKGGAMDSFAGHRAQLMAVLDRALQAGAVAAADRKSGQKSLFGDELFDEESVQAIGMPEVNPWSPREELAFEHEVLGYYLRSHPLSEFADTLRKYTSHTTSTISDVNNRDKVTVGGMVSAIKHAHVKRVQNPNSPTKYVMFDLEDLEGAIRCIQWPTEFAVQGELIKTDAVLVVQGLVDRRNGDEANLIVERVIPFDDLQSSLGSAVKLRIDERRHGADVLKHAYEIVRGYPGTCPLMMDLSLESGYQVHVKCSKLRVDVNRQMCERLQELLGDDCLELVVDARKLSARAETSTRWKSRA